jgi:predicted Rossmann fold flavoprotein
MGRIIVIGAGPAGMMAAIFAARAGARVLLLEKNLRPGKKLLLTGHGRCNLTNISAGEDLVRQYPGGGPFLHSSLAQFSSRSICTFFQELGVELAVEDQGRVFPSSGRAEDILEALLGELARLGVEIRYRMRVDRLFDKNHSFNIDGLTASRVILATGGASYPGTGSTGDGYSLAHEAGHSIIPPGPALVPLIVEDKWVRSLSGLSLPAQARLKVGKKTIRDQGQLLFTHFGLSGPLALNLSRYVRERVQIQLNLLPGGKQQELFSFDTTIGQRLDELMPHRLNRQLLRLAEIDPAARSLSAKLEQQLLELIFAHPLTVSSTKPLAEAMVTRGGVELCQVDPKTMESKIRSGLYFCGEVLDLDGISGGYNLTAAFATGHVAGRAAGRGG